MITLGNIVLTARTVHALGDNMQPAASNSTPLKVSNPIVRLSIESVTRIATTHAASASNASNTPEARMVVYTMYTLSTTSTQTASTKCQYHTLNSSIK